MKPFEHQVYHRNMNPCLAGFRQFFVVFAESPTPAQPGQGALHHPSPGQHLKPVAVRIPAHHAQHPITGGPSPRHQPPSVGGISPDDLEPGEPVQQLDQHQLGPIPVLDVGGMNCYGQEQPGGIHYNVALAPRYLLPRIVAPGPPFSVVFTDWLSMMAALGVASLPFISRTWLRSASSTRSQVPSARHFRKYHHTVPQGGRSWGAIRHGMPPCKTYSTPFTTYRRSTVRRRPLVDAGGKRGSKCSHWESVKSLGYLFRSTPKRYNISPNSHLAISNRVYTTSHTPS